MAMETPSWDTVISFSFWYWEILRQESVFGYRTRSRSGEFVNQSTDGCISSGQYGIT